MRYLRMLFIVALVNAVFLTSEVFAGWSDGGPEAYELKYPPETLHVSPAPLPTAEAPDAITGWSDGGPEAYGLKYPPETLHVSPAPLLTAETPDAITGWSDGGPEAYEAKYPPETFRTKTAFRIDSLLGKNVRNDDRVNMGSVDDVLVSENGRIKYVILGQGGFLGSDFLGRQIGNELYGVPWSVFAVRPAENMLTLNLSRDKLEMAPRFEKGEFAMLDDPEFEGKVHSYYGVKESMASSLMKRVTNHGTYLASSFMGADVEDAAGMKVGEVDDFVADEDGIINYVIVRHGGSVFGLGSKLTPVPWRIATLDDINHIVSIGTGKGKFMGAPIIMGNNWSRFDDPDWNMEIRDYFNK